MFLRHHDKFLNIISMIVIDECHNSGAPETKRILNLFKPTNILLGLSATPKRNNNNNYIQELFNTNFIMKMLLPDAIEK
jgi:superfamily II DNA or RNA helicase